MSRSTRPLPVALAMGLVAAACQGASPSAAPWADPLSG